LEPISKAGLGLPEREYYLKADDKSKQLREDTPKHVTKMFEFSETPRTSPTEAATILKIETTLATASMKNTDLRDPTRRITRWRLQISDPVPNFSWRLFQGRSTPELKEINVGQPDFFKPCDAQLTALPSQTETYLRWHLVNTAAPGSLKSSSPKILIFAADPDRREGKFSLVGSAACKP